MVALVAGAVIAGPVCASRKCPSASTCDLPLGVNLLRKHQVVGFRRIQLWTCWTLILSVAVRVVTVGEGDKAATALTAAMILGFPLETLLSRYACWRVACSTAASTEILAP